MDMKIKRGQILKELRKKKNLSQKEMSEFLNVSSQAYQKYEYGTAEPTFDNISKLADFYGVTVDYLFGREKVSKEQEVLNRLTAEYNLSEMDRLLVQAYISISPKERNKFMQTIQQIITQKEKQSSISITTTLGTIEDEKQADEATRQDAG